MSGLTDTMHSTGRTTFRRPLRKGTTAAPTLPAIIIAGVLLMIAASAKGAADDGLTADAAGANAPARVAAPAAAPAQRPDMPDLAGQPATGTSDPARAMDGSSPPGGGTTTGSSERPAPIVVPDKAHYCSQRSVLIRYRWTGAAPKGVQMWISADGTNWLPWQWSDKPDEPFRFEPPRQGRMLIALAPAEKQTAALPETGYQTLAIVFDWDEPLVRLIEAKRQAGPAKATSESPAKTGLASATGAAHGPVTTYATDELADPDVAAEVLRITWAAWDETFGPRPISLHWRTGPDQPWHLAIDRLPNSGEFAWPIPATLAGRPLEVCLRATDQAGNVAEAVAEVGLATLPEPVAPVATAESPTGSASSAQAAATRDATTQPGPTAAAVEAERLLALAEAHLQRNEYDLAEEKFRKALQADPTGYAARLNLGVLLQRRGRLDEAIDAYQAVLALKPDNITAWRNLALAYMNQRDYPRARVTLQKLLAVEADNPQSWIDLGDVEMLMGRTEAARQHWLKAKSLSAPNSETAARASKRLAVYTR